MAAILTDELTREGVYAALGERRCYATNGPRILLRAALDANRMGSTMEAPGADSKSLLYVRAIGTAPIRWIDVIRSGEGDTRLAADDAWDVATTLELEGLASGEYVYVRVIQSDGGAAWSSPVFLD